MNRNDNSSNMIMKYLSKFISKKDFIYKTAVGDFYLSYKVNEQIDKQISEVVLKLYLNEAKHNYKLKVFKVRIVKENGENGFVMFYGSVHVEMKGRLIWNWLMMEWFMRSVRATTAIAMCSWMLSTFMTRIIPAR